MNMNAVFLKQTPMIEQFNQTQATKAVSVPFRQIVAQASTETSGNIDLLSSQDTVDSVKFVDLKLNRLTDWINELSEEDFDAIVGWFEAEFDLKINNPQQLVTGILALETSDIELGSELIQKLVTVLELEVDHKEEDPQAELVISQNTIISIHQYLTNGESSVKFNNRAVSDSINQVIESFDQFTQQDARQLLDLLRQMQAINEPLSVVLEDSSLQDADQSKLSAFTKVYDNFLKKTTLADQTTYRSNTTVTSKDVLKWVKAALEQTNLVKEETTHTFGQMFNQQRTDSSIEQLQIQLGQHAETAEQVNEQLLTQFEKAISQSRFIQNLSGNNQLLLKLAPESLGTIMVELTEIDGEMLVKLTASSQIAKEALEANVRELRNMFAPHNIIIEKQEAEPIFVDQPSPYEDLPDEQEPHEQNQPSSQNEPTDRDDDSIHFEDLLYQERVL